MRLAILTTETVPHARFVAALSDGHEVVGVVAEATHPEAPFEVAHPFEGKRDAYEREVWFNGKPPTLADLAPTSAFTSLSTAEAASHLERLRADLALVLGTRPLGGPMLQVLKYRMLNLHGADPQDYRGQDPALWAIYHKDFAGLVVTVQYMEAEVNAGAILQRQPLDLDSTKELHQLRHAQTEAFINVAEDAVKAFSGHAMRTINPLQRLGRCYGFMPRVLKDVCLDRFRDRDALSCGGRLS